MIEINLLPERFIKKGKTGLTKIPAIPKEIIFILLGGIICILLIIHFILLGIGVVEKIQFSKVNNDWTKLEPQRKQIDAIKQEISAMEGKMKSIALIRQHKKISWSEKLNKISDNMVRGVWLTRVYFGEGRLKIEGSAVSQKGEEMISASQFIFNLKEDKRFCADLKDIELTSLQRRNVKSIEVVDFIITAGIKE